MPDTQVVRELVLNAKNRLEDINVEDLRSSRSTDFDRKRIQKKLEQWRERTVRELAPHLTEARISELCGIDIVENVTGVGSWTVSSARTGTAKDFFSNTTAAGSGSSFFCCWMTWICPAMWSCRICRM